MLAHNLPLSFTWLMNYVKNIEKIERVSVAHFPALNTKFHSKRLLVELWQKHATHLVMALTTFLLHSGRTYWGQNLVMLSHHACLCPKHICSIGCFSASIFLSQDQTHHFLSCQENLRGNQKILPITDYYEVLDIQLTIQSIPFSPPDSKSLRLCNEY